MFWLWFVLATFKCLLLYVLAKTGQSLPRRARLDDAANRALPENRWPSVGMIVPMAGADRRMPAAVRSLLIQNYPKYIPVLVTAENEEPAADLVRRIQKDYPHVRHVVAGPAHNCGQKNHNSLRGIAAVKNEVEVFVFCDSTHMAKPNFLRHLVGPIAAGEAEFSTGYHVVIPNDHRPVTLAYAMCVLLMRLLQAVSSFTQLWGGAMAMTREAFGRYAVEELWECNVVDDCSLSARLQNLRVPVRLCPGALLHTEATNHERHVWRAWMDRQVLFLKFCMPLQWGLLGFMGIAMAVPPLLAIFILLGGLFNVSSALAVLLVVLWVILLAKVLHLWRGLLRHSISFSKWFLSFLDAVVMFVLVYVHSLTAKSIVWHGQRYVVGRCGRVIRIERKF